MIVTSFFSASLRKVLNWVTDASIGNKTDSNFNIPLQASRPCTFTLVSVSPSDINVSLSGGVIYVTNNPRNNVTYSITVRATAGLISTNRTFTFTAYNNPPVWVTPTNVTFPKNATVSYQLQTTDSDTGSITYKLTAGALHPGLSMSLSGLITGNTIYNNATKTVTIEATDGITAVSRTISFLMPPYQRSLSFPQASTIPSNYSSGRGPIDINDTWLNSAGFVNVKTDLTVTHGTIRTYSNGGYTSTDGWGSGSPPTVSISVSNSYIASLTVTISGYVCGPWGKRGENHQSDSSYYYPGNSMTGTHGGTGVAIYVPCTFNAAGDVYGGGGGGGAGGAGLDAWAPSSGGAGGNGGNAIIIYSTGVTIVNNWIIGGGGGGGGGGWGSSINGTSDGGSGTDANSSNGYGGNGGYGTGSGSTSGGAGGGPGSNGTNGGTHSSGSYAAGGTRGMAIYSPYGYAYTLSPVGTIYGPRS